MQVASDRFRGGDPVNVSFEFFPPKSDEMDVKLWNCIERLAPLAPSFSVSLILSSHPLLPLHPATVAAPISILAYVLLSD